MLDCELCRHMIGKETLLRNPTFSHCRHCNADLKRFFPLMSTYVGLVQVDGISRHEYRLIRPLNCPECGGEIKSAWYDCKAGGGVMVLAESIMRVEG